MGGGGQAESMAEVMGQLGVRGWAVEARLRVWQR